MGGVVNIIKRALLNLSLFRSQRILRTLQFHYGHPFSVAGKHAVQKCSDRMGY